MFSFGGMAQRKVTAGKTMYYVETETPQKITIYYYNSCLEILFLINLSSVNKGFYINRLKQQVEWVVGLAVFAANVASSELSIYGSYGGNTVHTKFK